MQFKKKPCNAHDQQRFTGSKVAADWHELMIDRHIMRASIACTSEQVDPTAVQPADISPPQ